MRVDVILRRKGREVVTIEPDVPVQRAVSMLCDCGIGALVVSRDGRTIEGLIGERQIIRSLQQLGACILSWPVSRLMAGSVPTCRADDAVETVMAEMTRSRIRQIPVVDDHGELSGIVSIGDIVKGCVEGLVDDEVPGELVTVPAS